MLYGFFSPQIVTFYFDVILILKEYYLALCVRNGNLSAFKNCVTSVVLITNNKIFIWRFERMRMCVRSDFPFFEVQCRSSRKRGTVVKSVLFSFRPGGEVSESVFQTRNQFLPQPAPPPVFSPPFTTLTPLGVCRMLHASSTT